MLSVQPINYKSLTVNTTYAYVIRDDGGNLHLGKLMPLSGPNQAGDFMAMINIDLGDNCQSILVKKKINIDDVGCPNGFRSRPDNHHRLFLQSTSFSIFAKEVIRTNNQMAWLEFLGIHNPENEIVRAEVYGKKLLLGFLS